MQEFIVLSRAWWGGEVRFLMEPCRRRGHCTAVAAAVRRSKLPLLGQAQGHC